MKKTSAGFTIIELVVVIVIIGILATISIVGFTSIQQGARNTQRSSEISTVAEALENYYSKNGEYPNCTAMTQNPTSVVVSKTLPGLDPENLTAPSDTVAGHNSFVCVDPPTPAQYGYLNGVTSYTLKYKEEGSSNPPQMLDSRHHAIGPNYTLTLTTTTGGTVSGGGTFAADSTPTITAAPSQFYRGLTNNTAVWTGSSGCTGNGNGLAHTITIDSDKTCTAHFEPTPILAPSAPNVTTNTVSGTTTYSWGGTTSCSVGNTIGYRYDYTIPEEPYDSLWVPSGSSTPSTSAAFSTWDDGHHYNLAVQAYCYNMVTNGPWSVSGTNGVYVATPTCILTVNSAGNGTVSGGGSYDCGTTPATPTISATPNANYYFSNWTGTGCTAGSNNPRVITVSGAITCTANFLAIPYCTLTVNNYAGGTVGGGGTYDCRNSTTSYAYAYPSANYYFSGWSGTGCSGGSNPVGIVVNSNKTCTANFLAIPYCTLTVNNYAGGTVGGGGTYDCRNWTTSYAYAYPSTYYYFAGWSGTGCTGGGSNPAGITVNSNITCTANFGIIDITPAAPSVWYNGVFGMYVGFSWSGSCTGPNATIYYQWQANNGGTVVEGPSGVVTVTNVNTYYLWSSGTTYTFYVRAYCVNPVTSSGWGAWGSTNYYRDYWWHGIGNGDPTWVYYQDDGTYRRYKTTDTANAAPQSSGGNLVNPQSNPGVDFSLYPAQNNCKAIGGYTPTGNELSAMSANINTYGSGFYGGFINGPYGYRSNSESGVDKTRTNNRMMFENTLSVTLKTNTNAVRCVRD